MFVGLIMGPACIIFTISGVAMYIFRDMETLPVMCLGDMVFSYETIEKEAEEQNKTFKNHFTHMLIHSYLHLFAYDHIKAKERKEMESIEIEILKNFGIDNPYII